MAVKIKKQRIYESLVEDIRLQINTGVLRADNYLLPEYELAKKYQMSSHAVRLGLSRLEDEGLIRRYQGRGTVVLSRQDEEESTPTNQNIAVIFQGRVRDPSTAEELDNLQQAFQSQGYGTTLYVADRDKQKEAKIVQRLAAEGVPGLVLYSAHPSNSYAHLQAAIDSGMKIVVFDHDFPDLACNFVGIDDQLASYEATEHLIRHGCREMILVNSQRNWTTHVLRERGFEQAMEKLASGLARRVIRLPDCQTFEELGECLRQELTPMLAELQKPVGIVAWWDEVALHAMKVMADAGWSVPRDAKVVGFSNDLSGALADVPLTTMEIPREQIARLAAASLVHQMRDPTLRPQRIRLKARMILRQSCGTYRPAGVDEAVEESILSPVST
ncbi:MAG: GntR family transcriptional regulator [Phycisphaerales bacterium]|jgi:LacI family transcriptional regulator|nr:GntR family transcriptional regulator [Phycisphaerales bacterium]